MTRFYKFLTYLLAIANVTLIGILVVALGGSFGALVVGMLLFCCLLFWAWSFLPWMK